MTRTVKDQLEYLYAVYDELYSDQLVGACSEYADYLESHFAPPEEPWKDKEQAVSAMKNLVGEIYESCDNADELLEQAGYTGDLRKFVGGDPIYEFGTGLKVRGTEEELKEMVEFIKIDENSSHILAGLISEIEACFGWKTT